MKNIEAKQKLKKLRWFARNHIERHEDREDFVQYAMLRMLEGSTQNTHHLLSDFFRETHTLKTGTLDVELFYFWEPVILTCKNKICHAVFLLKYLYEFDDCEIAKLFGTKEAWVLQKIKQAKDFFHTHTK